MNLIFDFDGTICDSFEAAIEIIKQNFPEHYDKTDVTPEMARDIGFKGLLKISKFPKRLLPKLIVEGRKEMAKQIPTLKPYPTIPAVIEKLSKNNTLGILTSNSEENVHKFLKINKMGDCFDFVRSDFSFFGKHKKLKKVIKLQKLDLVETYYIGDETRDVEAGKKVNIKTVAVTWGFESRKVLIKTNPDYLISKPKNLLKLV